MDAQSIFTTVVTEQRKQNALIAKSTWQYPCVRSKHVPWPVKGSVDIQKVLENPVLQRFKPFAELFVDLQYAHDQSGNKPDAWEEACKKVAIKHNLVLPPKV